MKHLTVLCTLFVMLFFISLESHGQINIKSKIKKQTERAVDKVSDHAAEKGIDEAEKGVDKMYDEGKDNAAEKEEGTTATNKNTSTNVVDNDAEAAGGQSAEDNTLRAYSKYNFVPGDIVIFEDNLVGEENGEFPSKWDLKEGNVEIARYGQETVINFPDVNWGKIVPLMAEKDDYLPEKFTLEFDAYFSEFCTKYVILLYDIVNQKRGPNLPDISITPNSVSVQGYGSSNISGTDPEYPFWKRIAISFNIRALKVFYGEMRTNNIPNLQANPTGISLFGSQCHGEYQAMVKNIRIAKGHEDLYDKVVTEGKFTTNGIRFDIGKATIRPESMGVINQVYNMMIDHPELKFSVEGHTDSDGEEASNMKLSEERARAVVDQLVDMGIGSERLASKGFGESRPIDTNNTPEGKANNRRVEFIKL